MIKVKSFLLKNWGIIFLTVFIFALYYKFFIFGLIPFPGDLLVNSYSPWFDYFHTPIKNPEISDVFSQIFIWKSLAIDSYKMGQWPLWNPYSFIGTPLLANYQSATLYPLNFLILLPSGWGIFIFSQTLLAALGMYLFLSLFIQNKLIKITSAVIFSIGGLMTTWLELGIVVHGILWLPFSLYFIETFLRNGNFRYLFLLSFSLLLTLLAGHAQITIIVFCFTSIYILYRCLSEKNLKKLLLLITSVTVALLLSLPQLLPTVELLNNSIRADDHYIKQNDYGLLSAKNALRFFAADVLGNPSTGNYWGDLNYTETSGFVGILSLPLLIFFFIKVPKNNISRFFLFSLLFSLLFSFKNPLSEFIFNNFTNIFTSSYASRFLFLESLSISILIAFSLDYLFKNPKSFKDLNKYINYSIAALIGIGIGFLLTHLWVEKLSMNPQNHIERELFRLDTEYKLTNYIVSLRNLLIPFVFLIILKSIFLLQRFKLNISQIVFITITFLFLVDLGRYFLKLTSFSPSEYLYPTTPTIDFLINNSGNSRIGREHAEILPPNTWAFYKLSSFEGYDPLYLNNFGRFMGYLRDGNFNSTTGRYAEISTNYNSNFIDALGVKYFTAILRDNNGYKGGDLYLHLFKEAEFKEVFRDKASIVLENTESLPRAYFLPEVQFIDINNQLELFEKKKVNPKIMAIISDNLNLEQVTGKGQIEILNYTPSEVIVNTETSQEELLVLADQYDPNWKAEIDDKPTFITKTNLIFRGVKIPAGNHEIKFSYYPESFNFGLKIFFATCIILLIATPILIKKKLF